MPGVILACFALLYLGYPTYDYYFDGLTFAMAVEGVAAGGDPGWLFHPHHLIYSPAAYLFHALAGALGIKVRAWLAMQWLSSGLALAGLWLFQRLLRDLGASRAVAAAGMTMLGACYAYWHFGTQGESTIPATVALLVLLKASLARKPGGAVRMGLLQALAVLLHQTAILFAPAACWALVRATSRPARLGKCLAFLVVAGGATTAAYVAAGVLALDLTDPARLGAWILGYFGADPRTGYHVSYGSFSIANVPASGRAWAECMFGPGGGAFGRVLTVAGSAALALAIPWRRVAAAARGILAGGRACPRPLAPARRVCDAGRERAGRRDTGFEVMVLWLLAHALFFTWWKAGHARFWLLALPSWLALAAVGAERGLRWRGRLVLRGPALAWALAGLVAAAVGTGAFRREIRPECNPFLSISEALAEHTAANGTVVISGVGEYTALKAYVPYFSQRRMLIVDWEFADKAMPPARALEELRRKIGRLRETAPVYFLSEALSPDLDGHFRSRHGIDGASRRALFSGFSPREIAVLAPDLRLLELPPQDGEPHKT